jgi:hypothetical protein
MNAVQRAIEGLHGPTKASHLLGCSASALFKWAREGYVPKRAMALRFAAVCAAHGVRVSAAELAGYRNGHGT